MSILNQGFLSKLVDRLAGQFRAITLPTGKNLFNKDTAIVGKYITSNGTEASDALYYCSAHIPVLPGSKIIFSSIYSTQFAYAAFYKNGVFVSAVRNDNIASAGRVLNVPDDVDTVRISNTESSHPKATLQLEYGTVSTAYESYTGVPTMPNFNKTQNVNIENSTSIESVYKQGAFSPLTFPHGKNMFNKDTITSGLYLTSTGGTFSDANFYISAHIPVIAGAKIKANSLISNAFVFICFYKNGVFVSSVSTQSVVSASSIISVPANVDSMRISNHISQNPASSLQLEYGTVSTSYENFSAVPTYPTPISALPVSIQNQILLSQGKNLFNKNTVTVDKFINSSGIEASGVGFYCSDFIKVFPSATITLSNASTSTVAGTAFYDHSNKFISFVNDATIRSQRGVIVVPNNAVTMRVSGQESSNPKDSFQVEYGSVSTSYEAFQPLGTLPNFVKPQEVFLSELPSGFIGNNNYLFGKISLDFTVGEIAAIYENHVVWYSDGITLYYSNKGLNKDFKLRNSEATLTVLATSDLPGMISSSTISRVAIFKSKNGIRTLIFTSKNQVYYSDGQEFGNFKLSKIWTLPGNEFKHHSVASDDKDPSGTRYRYYMPANIASRSEQFGWFNSILWLKSESPNASAVESLIFANYHTGTNATAVPSCVFQTEDGENIYIQYMFGIPCGSVKKAGTSDYIGNSATGYGDDLDTSEFTNDYVSGLTIKKRINIIPSLAQSDPTDIFEILAPVNVTAFTKAKPSVATVSSAAGIVAGNVVLIDGDASDADWNALRNTTASATSGGNGRFYTVKSVAGNQLTLAETIGNPNNNLTPRHIHSLNFFANGIAIGTGETYPQSYLIFNRIHRDATSTEWRKNTILTTSEKALQRTIGVHLRKDNKILFSSDEMWKEKDIDALKVRGAALKSTVAGVWKGNLSDVDDASKFENVLWNIDPCFKFCELTPGVLLCVTNSGRTYLSFNDGDSWDYVTTDGNWKNHTIGFDKGGKRFFFDNNVFVEVK